MAQVHVTGPVTVTFSGTEFHGLSRDLVYVASTLEQYLADLDHACDPRKDAWVLAQAMRLRHLVQAVDTCVELLATAQARPVPTAGRRADD